MVRISSSDSALSPLSVEAGFGQMPQRVVDRLEAFHIHKI
jgi:hypothetical protein